MLSLEALFCHVDDFCRWFEPCWQQRLLGEGLQCRFRSRSLSLSQSMTILIAFHQSAYRNFKFLYPVSLSLLAPSLSSISQLPTLRGMDALHSDSAVRLLAPLLGQLYWHQLYGFDEYQGLPQPPHLLPQGVQLLGS